MIIVCPECSTKFKVKDERIPDAGAKVRCARCKHVFHIDKPAPETVDQPQEEAVVEQPVEQPAPAEPAPAAQPEEESPSEDFSYDRFREQDPAQKEDDSFSFSAGDESSEAEAVKEESAADDFSFSGDDDAQKAEKADPSATQPKSEEVEAEQPVAEEQPQAGHPAAKKSSPASSIIRILLLLVLLLLVIGGVMVYMNGPDQINQTIQQLLGKQQDQAVQTGRISLAKLEGKFIQNAQAGELFLIRGEAINDYPEPRAGIQVKGVIFDPNGKPLLQKTVFCGNPISDQDLERLSFPELEKIMGNQFGEELSNMKISPGQAIPFDIVFKELPQNLSEFSVKVTASKPASN